MIDNRSVLAVITARGGSKGLPGKNLKPLGGKPLIAWTIEAAKQSRFIDRVTLSSDDPAIIQTAEAWGCEVPFRRPAELATDEARSIDVVLNALDLIAERYDYVVMLQPTSPLRIATDIDNTIRLCLDHQAPACVSVVEADKPPFWMYYLEENDLLRSVIPQVKIPSRRQDAPTVYALNGAVYVARTDCLDAEHGFHGAETVGYVMTKERSVDIDSELDLLFAEMLLDRVK